MLKDSRQRHDTTVGGGVKKDARQAVGKPQGDDPKKEAEIQAGNLIPAPKD